MADKYYIVLHSTINALAADTLGQFTLKKTKTNILTSPRGSLRTRKKSPASLITFGGLSFFHLQKEQVELIDSDIS